MLERAVRGPSPAPRPPAPRFALAPSFSATPAPCSVQLHLIFGPLRSVFRSAHAPLTCSGGRSSAGLSWGSLQRPLKPPNWWTRGWLPLPQERHTQDSFVYFSLHPPDTLSSKTLPSCGQKTLRRIISGTALTNMLPQVKFAEDKVIVFVILREKCENIATLSLIVILTLTADWSLPISL